MRILSVLLCLCLGFKVHAEAPAAAGPSSPSARRVERALGDPVRVRTEGGTVDGRLLEIGTEALTLDVGASRLLQEPLPLSGVQELFVRGRHTGTGAAIGATAGGLAGAFLGMFFCLFGEYSTVNSCAPASVLSALGGGAVGGGLGAFFGSLIFSWDRVYERTLDGPLALAPERASQEVWARSAGRQSWPTSGQFGFFWSNALLFGSSDYHPERSEVFGMGARLNGLARIGPYLAVGPEVTLHRLFGSEERVPERFVVSLGALVRAAPRPSLLTPSLMVGVAGHSLKTGSYSLGAGLDVRVAHGTALALELHWHRTFAGHDVDQQLNLGLGLRSF
ncbi:hypothetical protein [Stigmatella erecta]|uniref:Outer membrane protein beta-barrel domain-containing protein n=1 Tax=Stigmatella erecta TaxID=83460 RepID=A0A1I0FZE7_9BACT|nr:hypothetical protein [Stigmatella erecta]SET63080.1 hypothetical protein SAMN05443639_103608 [Stigmatella erecta]